MRVKRRQTKVESRKLKDGEESTSSDGPSTKRGWEANFPHPSATLGILPASVQIVDQ